ncbi:hypothetical protein LINGRAHAP2_LOCUS14706, partial [Linum grandiflorum]
YCFNPFSFPVTLRSFNLFYWSILCGRGRVDSILQKCHSELYNCNDDDAFGVLNGTLEVNGVMKKKNELLTCMDHLVYLTSEGCGYLLA